MLLVLVSAFPEVLPVRELLRNWADADDADSVQTTVAVKRHILRFVSCRMVSSSSREGRLVSMSSPDSSTRSILTFRGFVATAKRGRLISLTPKALFFAQRCGRVAPQLGSESRSDSATLQLRRASLLPQHQLLPRGAEFVGV